MGIEKSLSKAEDLETENTIICHEKSSSLFSDSDFEESDFGVIGDNIKKFSSELFDTSKLFKLKNYGIIPIAAMHRIMLFLRLYELCIVMRSCKIFHRTINSNFFWEEYYSNAFNRNGETTLVDEVKNWKEFFFNQYYRNDLYYVNKYFRTKNTAEYDSDAKKNLKICFVGPEAAGKSAFILRFVKNEYSDDIQRTIGCAFFLKYFIYKRRRFQINIWDQTGRENFRGTPRRYYMGSACVVICFSLNDRNSFEYSKGWVKQLRCDLKYPTILLMGCKSDLVSKKSERPVKREEVEEFIHEKNNKFLIPSQEGDVKNENKNIKRRLIGGYVETSSKDGRNIVKGMGMAIDLAFRNRHSRGLNEE